MSHAIIDNRGHPAAPSFYRTSRREPILPQGDLVVTSIVKLGQQSALKLLQKIAAVPRAARAQPLLVVTHGVPVGLTLPLVPGSASRFQTNSLEAFEEHEAGRITSADAAQRLFLSGNQFQEFLRLRRQIRGSPFSQIEFRACNMGVQATLRAFQRFFGANSIGAPREEDAYNKMPHGRTRFSHQTFNKFLADHPQAVRVGNPGNRVAYVATRTGVVTWEIQFEAESDDAARNWYRTSFPGSGLRTLRSMWIHAQFGGGLLIFPGDQAYRANLVRVP